MNIFTIGFTKRMAEDFFSVLESNRVRRLMDVRLNNRFQLAGFTKEPDLRFFLRRIAGIDYEWWPLCAPSEDLLKEYQGGKIGWTDYVPRYIGILDERDVLNKIEVQKLDGSCLLCSERTAEKCHRRLLAEYLRKHVAELKITHL